MEHRMFGVEEAFYWGRKCVPWSLARSLALGLAMTIPFVSDLLAQPASVEIAVEPVLAASSHVSGSSIVKWQEPIEPEKLLQPTKEEGGRKASASGRDGKKTANHFLPPQRPIGQISIALQPKPKNGNSAVPEDLANESLGSSPVVLASTSDAMKRDMVFTKARVHDELFAYHPLYFEEANLERYGRNCGPLQPAISGLRFFATIPSLPYAMAVHSPRQTYIHQWPYDAGWAAPKVKELQPLQAKPTLVQTGAITGLLFVLP